MNGKLLILFVILVLGLILASFLGGSVIENMENPNKDSVDPTVKDLATTVPNIDTTTTVPNIDTTNTSPSIIPVTTEPRATNIQTTLPQPSVLNVTDVALSDGTTYPNISVPNMATQNMPNTAIISQCGTTATPAPVGPSVVQPQPISSQGGSPNPFGFQIITPSIPIPMTIPSFSITPLNPMSPQAVQTSSIQFGVQQQPLTQNTNIKPTSDFDNYNHFNKTSYPDQFYGTNGGTARIIDTGSNNMLVITSQNGSTDIYYLTGEKQLSNAYYGPNGSTAKVVTDGGVVTGVKVVKPDGGLVYYYKDQAKTTKSIDDTLNQASNAGLTESAPGSCKGSGIKEAFCLPLEDDRSKWMATLPKGVPKSQILPGEENLYILKSEVIPPVCPKCPEPIVNCPGDSKFENMKCPPCPPCARCPEAAFECKKVPNYSAVNNLQGGSSMSMFGLNDYPATNNPPAINFQAGRSMPMSGPNGYSGINNLQPERSMPVPVLSDFSSFGM